MIKYLLCKCTIYNPAYSKYEDWDIENDNQNIESFKLFLITLLVNTFKLNSLKNEDLKNKILEVLEVTDIKKTAG